MIARTVVLARIYATRHLPLELIRDRLPGIVRELRLEPDRAGAGYVASCRVELGNTPPKIAVRRISEQIGSGWLFAGEGATACGLWSPAPGASFVVDGVGYAQVEVLAFTAG